MNRCKHGSDIATSQVPEVWMGNIGHCACCRSNYGFIDSASYWGNSRDNRGHQLTYNDRALCRQCGGVRRTERVENGRVVFSTVS